jgi:hypothetical protein
MSKIWRLHWDDKVSYTAMIVADTEEEALRYFETGGEFYTEPKSIWAEMTYGPNIQLEREEV